MYTAIISLPSIETVKNFVNVASGFDFDVNLYSDKYVINGKSIMGIFSLDLSKPIKLEVEKDCSEKFKKDIEQFLVKDDK